MNAHTIIAPLTWDVVTKCHHVYTESDCHAGHLREKDGKQVFTGDVGRYRWQATVTLDVPYCSACDQELDAGICRDCQLVHADLVPLTEVTGDPFESASDWLLRAGPIARELNKQAKRDVNNGD